jgi:hypothetical protein
MSERDNGTPRGVVVIGGEEAPVWRAGEGRESWHAGYTRERSTIFGGSTCVGCGRFLGATCLGPP